MRPIELQGGPGGGVRPSGDGVRNTVALQTFDQEDREAGRAKKRLFVGLVAGTGTVMLLLLVLVWAVPVVGLANIHARAPQVFSVLMVLLALSVVWATGGLILSVIFSRSLPFFARARGMSVRLLLPLMTVFARLVGISKDRVRSSFVKVNNELVAAAARRYRPGEMLLLMPHCLQNSRCRMRLTYTIRNCKRCGECPIDALIGLSDRYGIHLAIATGGTIARRIVVQRRPRLILAVACERDLTSGIQDTYPIPVYGVLNLRPNGPCLDTRVNLDILEQAMRSFMDPACYPPEESAVSAAAGGTGQGKGPQCGDEIVRGTGQGTGGGDRI